VHFEFKALPLARYFIQPNKFYQTLTMKFNKSTVKAMTAEKHQRMDTPKPPLPLTGDDTPNDSDSTRTSTIKLRTTPSDENSPLSTCSIYHIDGTEPLRQVLAWRRQIDLIVRGLNLKQPEDMINIVQERCQGEAKSAFMAAIGERREYRNSITDQKWEEEKNKKRSESATDYTKRVEELEALLPTLRLLTVEDFELGLQAVIAAVSPYKVLSVQKRWLRSHLKKPRDMQMKNFVYHIQRMNTEELAYLPPFRGKQQMLTKDDIVEILHKASPQDWKSKMTLQDFDPEQHTIKEFISFCDRIEASEVNKPNGSGQPHHSNKKAKTTGKNDNGKWCTYHKSKTHDTSECKYLLGKQSGTEFKDSGNKKPVYKNKSWSRKAEEAKTYSKNEINAIVKKAIEEERKNWEKQNTKSSKQTKRSANEANFIDEHEVETTIASIDVMDINGDEDILNDDLESVVASTAKDTDNHDETMGLDDLDKQLEELQVKAGETNDDDDLTEFDL
jgi:hypothetical protein